MFSFLFFKQCISNLLICTKDEHKRKSFESNDSTECSKKLPLVAVFCDTVNDLWWYMYTNYFGKSKNYRYNISKFVKISVTD